MAQRKYVYIGQEKLTYSKAILKITGWTEKQFETQKRLMRYRVNTYNKAMGAKMSAIEELYYKVSFEAKQEYYRSKGKKTLEYNSIQQLLQDLKTTHGKLTARQEKLLNEFSLKRFDGLIKNYPQSTAKMVQDFKDGKLTLAQFNKKMGDFADHMRDLQKNNVEQYLKEKGQQIGS